VVHEEGPNTGDFHQGLESSAWARTPKELVKGTAELICMHGLSDLSEDTYLRVVEAADRIEFEPWMLQTGGEIWRRLLAVIPDRLPPAEVLMRMSRLSANSLQSLVQSVIDRPEWAKELLEGLRAESTSTG
jgi:hypothetical protein